MEAVFVQHCKFPATLGESPRVPAVYGRPAARRRHHPRSVACSRLLLYPRLQGHLADEKTPPRRTPP
jgi:hypothetical protein